MSRALRRQRQKALPLELAKRSIFDNAPVFRVCFSCRHRNGATRDWRPELNGEHDRPPTVGKRLFCCLAHGVAFHAPIP